MTAAFNNKSPAKQGKAKDNTMTSRLFFRMLPIQALIVAMGSINSIVDGSFAGRHLGADALAAIGLYYTIVRVLEAIGSMLLGGSTVLSGKYLGSGDREKTNGIFSLTLITAFICGAVITLVTIVAARPLSGLLCSDENLKKLLISYMIWYAPGIIPQLLAQQLASFLQMERQGKRCYIGSAALIISNAVLDLLFVKYWHMGIMGLALATAISNFIYFFILMPYYLMGRSQIRFHLKEASPKELPGLISIGFSGALLVFCLAIRSLVINWILMIYSGNDSLAAMTSFNMISGLFLAMGIGAGSVVRMLTSIFVGEGDRESIVSLIIVVLTRGMLISVGIGVLVFIFAPNLAGIFYTDQQSNVFELTRQLFSLYSICVPMVLLCQVAANYFQAIEHVWIVRVLSVFDGFLSMVIPSLLLAPSMGAYGVWLSLPIGIAATVLVSVFYSVIRCGHWPRSLDEWLLLSLVFKDDADNSRLAISLHKREEVALIAEQVQHFCHEHGIDHTIAMHTALCFEEMALNIFQHGFAADTKQHTVDLCMVIRKTGIELHIKDDCIPFNPEEYLSLREEHSEYRNIGIRLVYALASEVSYRNLMSLNVLTIRMA